MFTINLNVKQLPQSCDIDAKTSENRTVGTESDTPFIVNQENVSTDMLNSGIETAMDQVDSDTVCENLLEPHPTSHACCDSKPADTKDTEKINDDFLGLSPSWTEPSTSTIDNTSKETMQNVSDTNKLISGDRSGDATT